MVTPFPTRGTDCHGAAQRGHIVFPQENPVLTRSCEQIQRQEKALAQDSSRHLDALSRRGRFPFSLNDIISIKRRSAALRCDGEGCATGLGDHEERLRESYGQRGLERSLAGYLVLESLHLGSQGFKMRTSI